MSLPPVRSDSLSNAWVVTLRDESLILWQQAAGATAWTEIARQVGHSQCGSKTPMSLPVSTLLPSAIDADAIAAEGAVTETVTSLATTQLLAGVTMVNSSTGCREELAADL